MARECRECAACIRSGGKYNDDEEMELAAELWAMAQLLPEEGIEDGVRRVHRALSDAPAGEGLAAENARLREALNEIATEPAMDPEGNAGIARTALKGGRALSPPLRGRR